MLSPLLMLLAHLSVFVMAEISFLDLRKHWLDRHLTASQKRFTILKTDWWVEMLG